MANDRHFVEEAIRGFNKGLQAHHPDDLLSQCLAITLSNEDRLNELKTTTSHTLERRFLTHEILEISYKDALDEVAPRLRKAWNRFLRAQSKTQALVASHEPDLDQLFRAVQHECQQRTSADPQRQGRFRRFSSLCERVKGYKTMFTIIPQESPYCSLFFGSFWTLIEASAQYKCITEEVDKTITDIANLMNSWHYKTKGLKVITQRFIQLATELYVVLFEFLALIFDKWSKSSLSRLGSSLDATFVDKTFKCFRDQIRCIEDRINQEIRFQDCDRFQDVENYQNKLKAVFHHTLVSNGDNLGSFFKTFLTQLVEPGSHEENLRRPSVVTITTAENSTSPSEDLLPLQEVNPGASSALTELLKRMETDITEETGYVCRLVQRAKRYEIDAVIQRHVLKWFRDKTDTRLWIQGPHGVTNPSQNTMTAIMLTTAAQQVDTACIYYFCKLDPGEGKPALSRLTLQMLRSLISQLVLLLPADTLARDLDLLSNVQQLDQETLQTSEAITIFSRVRSLGMERLVIVIDGIQTLEDRSLPTQTKVLSQVIQAICSPRFVRKPDLDSKQTLNYPSNRTSEARSKQPSQGYTKVCFTTDGYIDVLGQLAHDAVLAKVEYGEEAIEKNCAATEWLEPSKI